jgi:hypothetical protein
MYVCMSVYSTYVPQASLAAVTNASQLENPSFEFTPESYPD